VQASGEIYFQETLGYPRPPTCNWRTGPRMDAKLRKRGAPHVYRHQLTKIVNPSRGLEFRPMLKAGSTVLGQHGLLPCLQPGEWHTVHQATPMPSNYTALVVVRYTTAHI
jgi:hypothetical protein